jgi:DinB superfamily
MRNCNFSCADYTIIDRGEIRMEPKIEDMITKMERSRAKLDAALDKIAPQTEIYPTWKVKQLMDHIAGWDVLVYTTLEHYSHGEPPSTVVFGGIDRYNAQSVSERKTLSVGQSRQAYTAARERVITALRNLQPGMLTQKYPAPWGGKCTISSIVRIFVSHEQEHAKQIEEILDKPDEKV